MKYREEMFSIRRIPCYRWYWDNELNEMEKIVWDITQLDKTILDFGSGDNRLKEKYLNEGFNGQYKTYDLSQENIHDFLSVEEIKGEFDSIFLFEVIEHMDLDSFFLTIEKLEKKLTLRGKFFISTPNPACVYSMWARDMTHIQQYPQHDLWAFFRARGFTCQVFRIVFLPKKLKIIEGIRFFIKRVICYFLSIDYADGTLIIAERNKYEK